ncbi:MAG: histidinol dehydrogenase, partial [Verrucomicrobiae bacterium]|nr:histidinol dehydrogenase [Verrucomicrobiae bacterium]
MNTIRHTDPGYAAALERMAGGSSLFDATIEERTRGIIEAVRDRGDAALLELTARFDRAELQPHQLAVTHAELLAASLKADRQLRDTLKLATRNIERFSKRSLRKPWSGRNAQGGRVGEKYDPFQRVGVYVPGGTAPLISTALMTIVLARVAGCPEIVVCTPCNAQGG